MATNQIDPDEPYRAYDTGFIGADPEAGFSAGAHGAYQLGKADRKAGRSHANRSEIAKAHHKAERQSRTVPAPSGDEGTGSPPTPAPSSSPSPSRRPGRRSAYFDRTNKAMSQPLGKVAAQPFSHVVRGDGTGLVLAVVLYPLLLSIVKYGGKGPGLYFQSKWLNKTPASTTPLPPSAIAAGGASVGAIAAGASPVVVGGVVIGDVGAGLLPKGTTPAGTH